MKKVFFMSIILLIIPSCTLSLGSKESSVKEMSASGINTVVSSNIPVQSMETSEQLLKSDESVSLIHQIPNEITLNGIVYPLVNSGVLGNMEKYRYGNSLGSGVISISKIMDGKFRLQNIWEDIPQNKSREDAPIVSLNDFIRRDTQEILGFLTFFEQMGATEEKFMRFWKVIKPYMGEQWAESAGPDSYEFAYIYPKFVNVNCYFYDGNSYYRGEFQTNFDGDSFTDMGQDEVIQKIEAIKATLFEFKGKFCASLKQ